MFFRIQFLLTKTQEKFKRQKNDKQGTYYFISKKTQL